MLTTIIDRDCTTSMAGFDLGFVAVLITSNLISSLGYYIRSLESHMQGHRQRRLRDNFCAPGGI